MVLDILSEARPDLLHVQISAEMIAISGMRDKLPCKTFLRSTIPSLACEDKYASYTRWREAGLTVPHTMMLHGARRPSGCFRQAGTSLVAEISQRFCRSWLIAIQRFQGSEIVDRSRSGWGKFVASECLEDRTVTWLSIWKQGELIVAQGRKRLYWEFSNRAPSGVTGITGTGVTISDPGC